MAERTDNLNQKGCIKATPRVYWLHWTKSLTFLGTCFLFCKMDEMLCPKEVVRIQWVQRLKKKRHSGYWLAYATSASAISKLKWEEKVRSGQVMLHFWGLLCWPWWGGEGGWNKGKVAEVTDVHLRSGSSIKGVNSYSVLYALDTVWGACYTIANLILTTNTTFFFSEEVTEHKEVNKER